MRLQYLLLAVFVMNAGATARASQDPDTVHEWGTFTSVAGEDGSAISWMALAGSSDLPCFVHRLDQRNVKAAAYGTVRMETPVLYFYPAKPTTFSIHVDFPNGRITEWFPAARGVQRTPSRKGWIEWNQVEVSRSNQPLPQLEGPSHYYAARQTDAWELKSENERDKLLFYRGIADFGVDLRALVNSAGVSLENAGPETFPFAIVFENHAGHTSYRVIRGLREPVTVEFSELSGTLPDLRSEFESELEEMGLYPKEAHAMLETWRDSWFEEGFRVFYILPRAKIDILLPLAIQPVPAQLVRAFVGRVELLSPQMREDIMAAWQSGDTAVLKKYGRFLDAFLREMSGNQGELLPGSAESARFLDKSFEHARIESQKLSCGK